MRIWWSQWGVEDKDKVRDSEEEDKVVKIGRKQDNHPFIYYSSFSILITHGVINGEVIRACTTLVHRRRLY